MIRISFLNGQFIDHSQAFVHIEDRGFQFADAVYEVVLFANKKLVDFKPHFERLIRSLNEINIKHNIKIAEIEKIALELFAKNAMENGSVYMQITRGQANRMPWLPKDIEPSIIMTVSPAKVLSDEEFENGASMMTHEDIRWQRCDIKTVGLLAQTLINQKAKDLGFDDALFVRNGIVTEATYSNFFIVDENDALITRAADNLILQGITRNRIIDLALKNGIKVLEKNFGVDEVLKAKEAFTSSSTLMLRPITKLDGKQIGKGKAGEITKKISELYKQFIQS
jgi:D-alanine transaminase